MTWILSLDRLADLGTTTAHWLWLPVLVWTAVVVPTWALLSHTSAHLPAQHRFRQALLAALPLGLIATVAVDASGWLTVLHNQLWPEPSGTISVGPAVGVPEISTSAASSTSTPVWSWTHAAGLATVIAAGGALVGIARMMRHLIASIRLRRSAAPSPAPKVQKDADALRHRLGIQRRVRVMVTTRDIVPMTLPGWPATVLLPTRLTDRPEALRMTLRHELVHVRRYDDLAHLAERLVAALFTAVPLVGWLQQSIARYREHACDAAVVADGETRRSAYARMLMEFADRTGVLCSASLSLSESSSALKRRLRAMQQSVSTSSTGWTSGAVIAALVAMTLGIAGCSDTVAPSPPEQMETSQYSIPVSAFTGEGPSFKINGESVDKEAFTQAYRKAVEEGREDADPLYVINGKRRGSWERLDPITSVELVTGAAATEAYGARGADGVIKYTTIPPATDDPLYVVDGTVRNSLSTVEPSDIASVEVTKGAAAVDAYGERGANGVIDFTMK